MLKPKRERDAEWRKSLTSDEAKILAEAEREADEIDRRRRELTRVIGTIRNRGWQRWRAALVAAAQQAYAAEHGQDAA